MDAAVEEHARLMAWVDEQKERRKQLTNNNHTEEEDRHSKINTSTAVRAQKERLEGRKNEQLTETRGSPSHTPIAQRTLHREGDEVDTASMPRTSKSGDQVTEDARGPCIGGLPEDELDAALHDALGVLFQQVCFIDGA
jgi:hypothetical protein